MSKLILGTAEFNPEGYGGKLALSVSEINKILDCAKQAGINIIDTAESYNCQEILRTQAKGFCIYTKTRDWKVTLDWGDNELRGILYHYKPEEKQQTLPFVHRWVNLGVSVYDRFQLPEDTSRILQVPFSYLNRKFEDCFANYRTVLVRSVFGNGECLKKHSVKDCLAFVGQFRPDGIIVGVNSSKELEEIVKHG